MTTSVQIRPFRLNRHKSNVGFWPFVIAGLTLGLTTISTQASEISFNGFVSAVGGKTLDDANNPNAFPCNCAVVDYPYVGTYEDEWSFAAESTFGLQANAKISEDFSVTVQIVSRGSRDYEAGVEWAYFSYTLNENWTLQGGRKRLPLFYYSDFFDVGYALPWIRAPGDLYGWQITGYDGFNAQYTGNWGDVSVTGNIWLGRDDDPENALLSEVYYGTRVDETWKDMTGAYLDLSWEWLTVRAVYMVNKVDRLVYDESPPRQRLQDEKQKFYGITANIDWNNLVIRSEYNVFDRPGESNKYKAKLAGIGYRFGDWLPMLTQSSFKETATWSDVEIHDTQSFSLRWDFSASVALKFQYDKFTDESTYFYSEPDDGVSDFIGDSTLIAFGIDAVF